MSIAAPHGTIEARTDRIRFNSVPTRQDISEVTYFPATGSRDEFFAWIREGVEKYGVDGESAER
ncbi:hypothetical protein DMH01_30705 [Amycolatopsis sp. WAC 04182]|uniref:hypothetical protein n=1 Tax=Amycolatopsis sp. WAC 04182 TaxID=2203198 RepID=UPI000F7B429F|nr:hypothetical protein [Amycolatopsis sp. WAC 04182]RSN56176.1 hypothetical protein DMH01_30705 [Amycolatopsis sp. WAC 04182]